jgi:Tfp pilus assembly protein PilN
MLTNLLPPKNRNEIFEEKIKNLIIIFGILISIFFLSFSLILFGIEKYISEKVNLEKNKIDFEKKKFEESEIKDLKAKITSLNKSISQLNSFYQEQSKLVEIFDKISEISPPQIYLTNFSFQKEKNLISLSGFSPTQEILSQFQKNLEEEFLNVDFPLQNWLKSTDIDFYCNFKIKK